MTARRSPLQPPAARAIALMDDVIRIMSEEDALDARLTRAARRIGRTFGVEHAHVRLAAVRGRAAEPAPVQRWAAILTAPVAIGAERIGRLEIATRRARSFTGAEARLLRTIGRQLAVSVTSARLQERVQAGPAEWERTFDTIGDALVVFDADGRVLRVNATLAANAGAPVDHLLGRRCCDLGLCGGDFPRCLVGEALAERQPVAREVTTADGREFVASATPIANTSGEVLLVAREVTEEHMAARRLRDLSVELTRTNEELRSTVDELHTTQAHLVQAGKLSALGQLVAGVAHELNNPLTSVMGYAQLVQQQLLKRPDVTRRARQLLQDVSQIVAESDRAARIVRNLLLFARRQTFARAAHDLAFLCAQVLDLRAYDLRMKNIEVAPRFPDQLPAVFVDPSQIQQALLNLVLNAEQAMAASTARRLEVTASDEPGCGSLLIEIRDTGHGIASTDLARVFDPFFTTRGVGEGTGLGLSIVFGIVRDHGGQIWVESQPDAGSAFFVRLPAVPVVAESGAPPVRVLLTNADPAFRDFLQAVFTAWGFDVAQVRGAGEAVAQLSEGGPAVVVVDRTVVEAEADRWREAWASRPQGSAMIAMLSGGEDPRTEKFLRDEATAVLVPSSDLCQLRRALEAAVGSLGGTAPPASTPVGPPAPALPDRAPRRRPRPRRS